MALFLSSKTFLWEFECNDATKVGLTAGRYSAKSRSDRNRMPHALHRVLGPIGPSLHCGVFVTSQCIHFLGACDSCGEDLFISILLVSREISFFLCFFLTILLNNFPAGWPDLDTDILRHFWKVGEVKLKGLEYRRLLFERRWRLPRGRFAGMAGSSKLEFSTEGELPLPSKTETGLLVWNWCKSFPFKETFWIGIVLPCVAPAVFANCFLENTSNPQKERWNNQIHRWSICLCLTQKKKINFQ